MFFRNVVMFRFPTTLDFNQVAQLLPAAALKPVGPLEMCSRGFISPYGREETEQLYHSIDHWLWLAVGTQEKILPLSAVNAALAEKIQQIERAENRRPGGRERKRIKDDLLHEMLPKAFIKHGRFDVFLDTRRGVAFIDTSSRREGENVISDVRGLLGSFPAMPLNAEVAPRSVLTGWLAGEPMPQGVELGEECRMEEPAGSGALISCQKLELRCEEIDKHLQAGMQASRLALVLQDNLSLVLGDDLVVRKLKFLDGALDKLADTEGESRRVELDARFALQTGELGQLFDLLEQAFKLSKAEG